MSLFAKILDLAGGKVISRILDKVAPGKLSPKEVALLEAEYDSLIERNKGIIMTAEASNESFFTSGARPCLLWICHFIIVWNYCIPAVCSTFGYPLSHQAINLPEGLWELFKWGYLGYVGGRSYEKIKNVSGKGKSFGGLYDSK
jgi:hypothetical protein